MDKEEASLPMAAARRVRDGNGSGLGRISKEVVGRNLYLYLYLRVEIHTYTRTCWVSGGYRVHVEFVILHVKNSIKIISLMSKTQYTHVQN
jgi:hypothetical protein